jgi:hypothetical protein
MYNIHVGTVLNITINVLNFYFHLNNKYHDDNFQFDKMIS